jgi:hypothetical protein
MDDMAAALEPYFEGAKEHMLQFDNAGVDFFPKVTTASGQAH